MVWKSQNFPKVLALALCLPIAPTTRLDNCTHHRSAWKGLKERESCRGRRPRCSSPQESQCSYDRRSPFSCLPTTRTGLIRMKNKAISTNIIVLKLLHLSCFIEKSCRIFLLFILLQSLPGTVKTFKKKMISMKWQRVIYFGKKDDMMVASSIARLWLTILVSATLIAFWIAMRRRLW